MQIELKELQHNLKDRTWEVNPVYPIDENEAKKLVAAIEKEEEEKTTRNISPNSPEEGFICEKCGIEVRDWNAIERDEECLDTKNDEWTAAYDFEFKYCPQCGRKVIDQEVQHHE